MEKRNRYLAVLLIVGLCVACTPKQDPIEEKPVPTQAEYTHYYLGSESNIWIQEILEVDDEQSLRNALKADEWTEVDIPTKFDYEFILYQDDVSTKFSILGGLTAILYERPGETTYSYTAPISVYNEVKTLVETWRSVYRPSIYTLEDTLLSFWYGWEAEPLVVFNEIQSTHLKSLFQMEKWILTENITVYDHEDVVFVVSAMHGMGYYFSERNGEKIVFLINMDLNMNPMLTYYVPLEAYDAIIAYLES